MKAAARKPQDAATITVGLLAILDALAGAPIGSPAAGAYTAAVRRRGEELAAIGGVHVLREARAAAIASAPDRNEARGALIDAAWSSILGWTS